MRVLVTGGTGFVGRNLIHLLHDAGHEVTLLHRRTSKLHDLPDGIRTVQGDVTDADSIAGVCEGIDWVFHVAGEVSWGRYVRQSMSDSHVKGTQNMVNEAKRAGVRRFVQTSSAAAVGLPDSEEPVDETYPFDGGHLNVGYAIAKRKAEEIVLRAVDDGLPAVVVNPTVIFGIRTYTPNFVAAVAKGRLTVAPDGGVNLCDVRDVARGHLLAAEKGRIGERYILGGTNLPFAEAFRHIARLGGSDKPIRVLKRTTAIPIALISEAISWINGREPALAWDLAKLTGRRIYYSSQKAQRELGYTITPFDEAMRQTVDWLMGNDRVDAD